MIDEATKQRIIDAAGIVDVVGDYISLRKQGTTYVGLCPFHNDRRPSFHVSPSKNICKCFACGEGGTPVSFIMKMEKLTFPEALKHLAKKYHIPIEEREENDEERRKRNEAESMFLAQKFAAEFFTKQLLKTQEGLDIASPYLRERGIGLSSIEKFGLGYAPAARDALYKAATAEGFNLKYFVESGLCYPSDEGRGGADRFRERIIFPIHTISGRIVGFGGRIMRKSDKLAKYINSPESPIYSKSNELYGLFLAKKAISTIDKCFLVEGYMDVIAMHEAGIENVVASSGTALTLPQIRLIRRFSRNITVFYDGDAAGIKAALRGIDLLLEADMHVRVLLLPEGEDPDSFSRSRTTKEFDEFIEANETDFITFKASLFREEMTKSPLEKSALVSDILRSIAIIPDPVERSLSAQSVAQDLSINEEMVMRQVKVLRSNRFNSTLQEQPPNGSVNSILTAPLRSASQEAFSKGQESTDLPPFAPPSKNERAMLKLIVRYGEVPLPVSFDDGTQEKIPLATFVGEMLASDQIDDCSSLFTFFLDDCCSGLERNQTFLPAKHFSNHEDPRISTAAIDFLSDKYFLSAMSRQALGLHDQEQAPSPEMLYIETVQLINGIKGEYVRRQIDLLTQQIKELQADLNATEPLMDAMRKLQELNKIKKIIAETLGNRTIIP